MRVKHECRAEQFFVPCMSFRKPAFMFGPISVTAVEIDPISFRNFAFSSSSVLKRASITPPPDPPPVSA